MRYEGDINKAHQVDISMPRGSGQRVWVALDKRKKETERSTLLILPKFFIVIVRER